MSEKPRFIAGARIKPDGSLDISKAAVLHNEDSDKTERILTENELRNLSNHILSVSEFGKKVALGQIAKEKGTTPDVVHRELNDYKIAKIKTNEKGEIRHFHRTSVQNLKIIAELGQLLSRSKLKEIRPDLELPGWSASDNVMFTRDQFNAEGDLVRRGFTGDENEMIGASGNEVVLVFKQEIMDSDAYDATSNYPSVSNLPLENYCEVILVGTEEDSQQVESILTQYQLQVPIQLKHTWKRSS